MYKTYNHEFGIEFPLNIYTYDLYYDLPTDEMFSNFPTFLLQFKFFALCEKKIMNL